MSRLAPMLRVVMEELDDRGPDRLANSEVVDEGVAREPLVVHPTRKRREARLEALVTLGERGNRAVMLLARPIMIDRPPGHPARSEFDDEIMLMPVRMKNNRSAGGIAESARPANWRMLVSGRL